VVIWRQSWQYRRRAGGAARARAAAVTRLRGTGGPE